MSLQPTCPPVHRPQALLAPGATAHGLRAVGARLVGGQRFVDVWLYADPPAELADRHRWELQPAPGAPPVDVAAAAIESLPNPHVVLTLSGTPTTARYRLVVRHEASVDPPLTALPFDPLRTWLPVRLRPECPDLGACADDEEPAPERRPSPVHDYLARDWRSLRHALLEFLVREHPTADLSVADPTVTAAELFAHVGDLLHYRLDRVATEAYLETARLRTSVRRHARLVDFRLREAVAAATPVLLLAEPTAAAVDVTAGSVAVPEAGSPAAFALDADRRVQPALGEIAVYDWSEDACCLPAGATEAVLVRPVGADALGDPWLVAGDLLVFEVVDATDSARHRDWSRRVSGVDWPLAGPAFREPLAGRTAQVVRLTGVAPLPDPLAPALPTYRVTWAPEDALARPYPVGIDAGAGAPEVTVARANLVPAHHGRLVDGVGALVPRPDGGYELPAAGLPGTGPGLARRPDARPYRLDVRVGLPSGSDVGAEWVPTLLEATPGALYVTVETEEHEPPVVRFRTGAVGTEPPAGSEVVGRYETGGGTAGNVAPNALRVLEENTAAAGAVPTWEPVPGLVARNPVAATGGTDPMPLDVARRDAPEAFAVDVRRAVLPADHAEAASRYPGVQRAVARREWSGSWPVVTAVVDAVGGGAVPTGLAAHLDDLRMLGTEVAVVPGAPVGLYVGVEVCARPGIDPERLRRQVLAVLRPGTDERPGFFHPSRMVLGGSVHLSGVLALVSELPGVDAVELREARRLSQPAGTRDEVVTVGPGEVPVLDDDPSRPERGRLDVRVRGGGLR